MEKENKILKWIDELQMYDDDIIVNISVAELRELKDAIQKKQSPK